MVGLGTVFIAVMLLAALVAWRGELLYVPRDALGADDLRAVALYREYRRMDDCRVGSQPWLIYGSCERRRASRRASPAGNVLFTLMGFMGIYAMLAILFLFLIYKEIERGPAGAGGVLSTRRRIKEAGGWRQSGSAS